jgi:hypothetical protein
MGLRFEIRHVDGAANHFLDLLSRWGVGGGVLDEDVEEPLPYAQLRVLEVEQGVDDTPETNPEPTKAILTEEDEEVIQNLVNGRATPEVPSHLRFTVLQRIHDGNGGHRGKYAMIEELKNLNLHWKNQGKAVEEFLRTCVPCQASKRDSEVPRPMGTPIRGTRPNQVLSMDFQELIHEKTPGSKVPHYVLNLRDSFTGYSIIYATEDQTAESAMTVLGDWVSMFGFPEFR